MMDSNLSPTQKDAFPVLETLKFEQKKIECLSMEVSVLILLDI